MEAGIGIMPHDSRCMTGRDPHQAHRVATPLELLFDLTFATSFGLAASEAASVLAEGHFIAGVNRFVSASLVGIPVRKALVGFQCALPQQFGRDRCRIGTRHDLVVMFDGRPSCNTIWAHSVARLEVASCVGDDLSTGRMIRCLDAYDFGNKGSVILVHELEEFVLR